MANLNLSEFTEKLFVTDADHTFIWDTVGAISKRVSRNSWLNSGTLTSDAPVTISQTWGNNLVTFTGLKFNADGTSDANSASGSRLLDLQLNGVSKLSVTKAGTINFGEVQANFDPYISRVALGTLAVSLYGFNQNHVSMGYSGGGSSLPGVTVSSGGHFAWSSSSTNSEATRDTILLRDGAANTLALRNGANAQTFNVYGTYTSGASYARLAIACDTSGNATLTTQSTGVAGSISIGNAQKIIAGAPNNVTLAFLSADVNGVGLRAGASNLEVVRGDAGAFANLKANDITVSGSLIVSNTPITSNSNVAGTDVESTSLILTTTSNGTTAAGFGTRLLYRTETDTNVLQDSGAISSVWSNTVNANRTSDMLFYNVLNGTLTERMRIIGTSGNVGIGTTSPTSKLDVVGAVTASTYIKVTPVAVSALPVAATAGVGARAFVNDALTPVFGSAVTGGGAVAVPVYSTGSAWNVG